MLRISRMPRTTGAAMAAMGTEWWGEGEGWVDGVDEVVVVVGRGEEGAAVMMRVVGAVLFCWSVGGGG